MCIPCLTHDDVRLSATQMKSILKFTNRTLAVYFVTTTSVKHGLETLYTTWDLQNGSTETVDN